MRVFAHRFFLLTLACMLCLGASAKKKEKGVYLFGYGTALLDSTVYLSAPVFLDSATIDPKTKIVHSIVRYSNQFQSYVEALYQRVPCSITPTRRNWKSNTLRSAAASTTTSRSD